MNFNQLQYEYWQRTRKQNIYQNYMKGVVCGIETNPYDKISRVSDDWFLNFIEYDAKNISPDKANRTFMTTPELMVYGGMCTGVHKGKMHLRQLDWYFNEEVEFVIRMKKCIDKGVLYDSIGVTATSPKLTREIVKDHFENDRYNPYFELLPYLTVDGVNEKGIFAQSNVVEVNGIKNININPNGNDCCCSVMLVRYILDHIGNINELESYLNTLHLYNAPRDKMAYNNHILVADKEGNTRIIEFFEDHFEIVDKYSVMTNFRVNGNFKQIDGGIDPDWSSVEWNGIGLERWTTGIRFVNDGTIENMGAFRELRDNLRYTHAYDRPFEANKTWLTDNLSSDLSVMEAKAYHEGTLSGNRLQKYENTLASYRKLYEDTKREYGNTWITTHGAIYDLENLSCNIQSQETSCWSVYFDGKIELDS